MKVSSKLLMALAVASAASKAQSFSDSVKEQAMPKLEDGFDSLIGSFNEMFEEVGIKVASGRLDLALVYRDKLIDMLRQINDELSKLDTLYQPAKSIGHPTAAALRAEIDKLVAKRERVTVKLADVEDKIDELTTKSSESKTDTTTSKSKDDQPASDDCDCSGCELRRMIERSSDGFDGFDAILNPEVYAATKGAETTNAPVSDESKLHLRRSDLINRLAELNESLTVTDTERERQYSTNQRIESTRQMINDMELSEYFNTDSAKIGRMNSYLRDCITKTDDLKVKIASTKAEIAKIDVMLAAYKA